MPALFRGRCQSCDEGEGSFADEYRSVVRRDQDEVVLPHPGEAGELAKHGLTWRDAWEQGLLRHYEVGICTDCSRTSPHMGRLPRPALRPLDRIPGLLLVVTVVAAAAFGWNSTYLAWGKPLVAVGYSLIALFVAFRLYHELQGWILHRFPPPLPVSDVACSLCDGGRLFPLGLSERLDLRCPACGSHGYRLERCGVS